MAGIKPSNKYRAGRPPGFSDMALFIVIAGVAALFAFPFITMLSISLQSDAEIYSPVPVVVPAALRFDNYLNALGAGDWPRYFHNSLVVTAVSVTVSLIINSMAGYVFARIPFKFSNALFMLALVGMMIPAQVTMIPVFTMLRQIPLLGGNDMLGRGGRGLYNTLAGLILPFVAGSFGVFFCRQFYLTFPSELDDSSALDGCGRFRAFVYIYLPLGKPMLASLGILKFTGSWNEYTWPLIMTRSDGMKTVQLALAAFRDEAGVSWSLLMAAAVMVSVPIYVIFTAAQKYFIAGMLEGAVNK